MRSVVDKPKTSDESDLLEIEKYTNGLINFIESSATPITIGVQGEWGSGKTSLLYTIKEDLCDKPNAKHYPIWINTWEYSLLSSPDETLIKIIVGLIDQIGLLTQKSSEDSFKKLTAISRSLLSRASSAGGVLGVAAGIATDVVDGSTNTAPKENSIRELRESLQIVIDKAIESSDKQSFIFFIDDLDRLDPAVAVSILELIKNLFDLKNCIFVLAIDYGVVVKGLQSKFGVMTEENEWEFRAFFDKIIQLPFTMPISSYNIEKYLKSLLVNVNYFTENDLKNEETLSKIAETVALSVGTNPRALKRLANSVALIEIIRGEEKITPEERVVEFALICIQIAYPTIYGFIQKESDFTAWDEQFVYTILKNKKINETDLETLKELDEFDEDWEQNVWRICQISNFLKQRSYQLSKLLNFIRENIPENKEETMKETLDRLLSMSSVTSVSADSVVVSKKTKRVPKKIQVFRDTMNAFIEGELTEKYSEYIGSESVSKIKLDGLKDRGNVYISVKTKNLEFNLCIWINYSKIDIYVDNKYTRASSLASVKEWFEKHLKVDFPNMKLKENNTRFRIITLDSMEIDKGKSRDEALNEYKEVINRTLGIFLPKISENN